MLRFLAKFVLVLFLLGVGVSSWLYSELHRPFGEFSEPVLFEYLPGTRSRETATALEQLGIVRSRWYFLAARALRPRTILMAGEYQFAASDSPWGVVQRLAEGDVYLRTLTIPEGLTRFETAALVAQAGYSTEEEFLALTADPTAIRDLFPQAQSLEGVLFPETYSLAKTTTGEQIIQAMLVNFRRAFAAASQDAETEIAPYDAVTLASLIEKESGVPSERPLISAVFHNRMDRGMRMQCDPTIIYGLLLEGRYRGNIYASDLQDPHPYNTYVHPGLPPGPIANPSAEALRAAFAPEEADYIFFVANPGGTGDHTFSVSLADHNRAVARLRAASN